MDFGLLLPFRNPKQWAVPFPQLYQDHIEQAVLAEELGYDHIWTTEHHFADDAWAPSLFPILSAIAMQTSRIRLGTYIIILPLHNPVRVAEDAATVDIISDGRLDLGIGHVVGIEQLAHVVVGNSQPSVSASAAVLSVPQLWAVQ